MGSDYMGSPDVLCLSTQPKEPRGSRERILLLYFSKYPQETKPSGSSGIRQQNSKEGCPRPCVPSTWALLSRNPRRKKRLSLCFGKMQENNLKHKNNQHVYRLQTVFTLLFSSVPHPGCVRKWATITIILPVKRALELSIATQLTYSSQGLNPGLFDSKSHVCAMSLHHSM